MMSDKLMTNYAPQPVAFSHGEGAWLWDKEGKRYLDAVSGIAVCSLGHAHPAISKAICEQSSRLMHTSNLYQIEQQQQLAERLTTLAGMERAFFCNSGAEANEAAIKIARLYGHQNGIEKPTIIVTENSFHGRTMATLTATGNRKVQAGFEPLVQGFVRVPYNDLDAVRHVAQNNSSVVAILVEPVQGEGGVNIPDDDYLDGLRAICDDNDWLLMLDEIQTGMCRTGEWFAFQHTQSKPDVMTLAKALGNGMPIGACLARGKAAETFKPGSHGTTYGGNPLACHTALAVIDTMESLSLPHQVQELASQIMGDFQQHLAENSHVLSIRNKGLLIGIELDQPCSELVAQAREQGILINVTAERVVRLLPPLIINYDEAGMIVKQVSELINQFCLKLAS
jgi:acetylornithine aminotransferase